MKIFISTRSVIVDSHFVSVVYNSKPSGTPEVADVKNIKEATNFINDYIIRNVTEGYKHLVVRKEGRAFAGYDALYKSIPAAVEATTRL